MQIKNKIFPYPILNQNINISDYNNSAFNLTFNGEIPSSKECICRIENNKLIINKASFYLKENKLEELLHKNKIECRLVVESSESIFRKSYKLTLESKDIEIDINKLFGKITISAFIYATDKIVDFNSPNFNDIYNGYTFKIDKYDILAADDGYDIELNTEKSNCNNISSIFTIVMSNNKNYISEYEILTDEISIRLPKESYSRYISIKNNITYKNIAFAMIAISPLSNSLNQIKKERFEDLDEIIDSYKWFKSICISYKKETGNELTFDLFNDLNSYTLAQIVLDYSTCKGLEIFSNLLFGNMEEENE